MQNRITTQNNKTNYIFILLLLGLMFLRFPFLISLSNNIIPISKVMGRYIFEDGTYLITAMLIILKRDSLSNYNMGFCSLLIFMVAPVAELPSVYVLNNGTVLPNSWFKIVTSVCLFILLLFYHPKLRKRSIKEILLWLLIAVVVGICSGVLFGYISSFQGNGRSPDSPSVPLLICTFFFQLSFAAVIEEPFFRGFLWGFLRNIHWKDYWIWLFQAALFMLGHIYYFGVRNYSFWIVVPVAALILGLLVLRSRSIGTSMIAHGLINSVADIVAHFTW